MSSQNGVVKNNVSDSQTMISLSHISKIFKGKDTEVQALDDVTFDIERGAIQGIIGMSGAGKSTLVRVLNYLEKPTEGTVIVDGKDLASLSEKELREERMNISMVFQHFNLLMQRNVLGNICFPLEIAGVKKADARKRAKELLEIVNLSDKANAYPAQLSGGQKQRVAIARALATNPKILLCDEATSALDPSTTASILELLQSINKEFGITIVIITHEMSVVQKICTDVAILENGKLMEKGSVNEVFTHPKTKIAKKMVYQKDRETSLMEGKRCIRIVFDGKSSFEPVIANMILACNAPVNILLADTEDVGGIARGQMIVQLPEDMQVADRMIEYLIEQEVQIEEVKDYVG